MRKALNVKRTVIFLFLPAPLKEGGIYSVKINKPEFMRVDTANGLPDGAEKINPPELSFKYAGDMTVSSAISANQAGYLPNGPKFAYIGQYAGAKNGGDESAELDARQFRVFKIISAESGNVVFEGAPVFSAACAANGGKDPLSECGMAEMNFSALTKPGTYRVLVPGLGVSYPFAVRDDVYNQVCGVLARGIYHQRCGTALSPEFTAPRASALP